MVNGRTDAHLKRIALDNDKGPQLRAFLFAGVQVKKPRLPVGALSAITNRLFHPSAMVSRLKKAHCSAFGGAALLRRPVTGQGSTGCAGSTHSGTGRHSGACASESQGMCN